MKRRLIIQAPPDREPRKFRRKAPTRYSPERLRYIAGQLRSRALQFPPRSSQRAEYLLLEKHFLKQATHAEARKIRKEWAKLPLEVQEKVYGPGTIREMMALFRRYGEKLEEDR